MPLYKYKARDSGGSPVSGVVESENLESAARKLAAENLYPSSVKPAKVMLPPLILNWRKAVSDGDLLSFTIRLAALHKGGVQMDSALAGLSKSGSGAMGNIAGQLRASILSGHSLSDSMASMNGVFPGVYIAMTQVGEFSGTLDKSLVMLAAMLEKQMEFRETARQAVRYPKMVLGAMAAALAFLFSFVIPRYVSIFERADLPLPAPTRILIGMEHLLQNYWLAGVAAAVALVVAILRHVSTTEGRLSFDRAVLKIPLIGEIVKLTCFARWADALGNLIGAGAPLLRSMELAAGAAGNTALAMELREASREVAEGAPISTPLRKMPHAPVDMVLMIESGEASGTLDKALLNASKFMGEEAVRRVKSLSAYIEPALVALAAGLVLFLALSIFMPMWDITKLARPR